MITTGHFDTSTLSLQVPGKLSDETEDGEMTYQPGLLVFSGGTAFNNIAGKTNLFISVHESAMIASGDGVLHHCCALHHRSNAKGACACLAMALTPFVPVLPS